MIVISHIELNINEILQEKKKKNICYCGRYHRETILIVFCLQIGHDVMPLKTL